MTKENEIVLFETEDKRITLPVEVKDEKFMFSLIRASFNQRRKTLVNGLTNAANLSVTKEQIVSALEQMNLSSTIRGEALTLEQFAALANLLS